MTSNNGFTYPKSKPIMLTGSNGPFSNSTETFVYNNPIWMTKAPNDLYGKSAILLAQEEAYLRQCEGDTSISFRDLLSVDINRDSSFLPNNDNIEIADETPMEEIKPVNESYVTSFQYTFDTPIIDDEVEQPRKRQKLYRRMRVSHSLLED